MKKIANFIVEKRIYIFITTIICTILALVGMNFTNINKDMSKYLPNNSNMKQGLDILKGEFNTSTTESKDTSFKIMFKDLEASDKEVVYEILISYDEITSVEHEETDRYERDGYSLYICETNFKSTSKCEKFIDRLENKLDDNYKVYTYYKGTQNNIVGKLVPIAFLILIIVLLLASKSFVEPFLILLNIGIAVMLNMGTNFIFPSVSDTTNSIASVLQLILSIDYSIIFINRYRQEKLIAKNNKEAMKNTVLNSFSSIIAASLTTFLGLLALSFMSFKIGMDMGVVLAKGVLFSLICIFTVFPTILLLCDKIISKTEKKYLLEKIKNKKKGEIKDEKSPIEAK